MVFVDHMPCSPLSRFPLLQMAPKLPSGIGQMVSRGVAARIQLILFLTHIQGVIKCRTVSVWVSHTQILVCIGTPEGLVKDRLLSLYPRVSDSETML